MARSVLFLILVISCHLVVGQGMYNTHQQPVYPRTVRVADSLAAMKIPRLSIPDPLLTRQLPPVVDNTLHACWPDIYHQGSYYSCQQYAGVVYTFAYQINRLRGLSGSLPENRYPAHYTWSFMNNGGQYEGVNFLQSFDVIKQQGHMTYPDFGWDTIQKTYRWANGYDKYYHGMSNRIRQVYAIEINGLEGINALKQYLFDHLDGSSVGGIACFTTDSYSLIFPTLLPPGTPEEGKRVVLAWEDNPVHGLTIVGYNDSIRYDWNNDGLFTNHLDNNEDGVIDAKDWEIGGFKFANSYGEEWADSGFSYVLYSAMANNFKEGGVWNNRVYVVEADTGYHPLLTVKSRISYNRRSRIRLIAGINVDTLAEVPSKTIDFPIFNFQGADQPMTGLPGSGGDNSLEMGLDLTPLLNQVPVGKPVKLFFGVDERDPTFSGTGIIHQTSFISYTETMQTFLVKEEELPIGKNQITYVSTVATLPVPEKVTITTVDLPALVPTSPYSVQLSASGGRAPYTWRLSGAYLKQVHPAGFRSGEETKLYPQSESAPYTSVKLPFMFPFFGQLYDTIYANSYGFISFEPQSLPAPFITDEAGILMNFPVISPAFSQLYSLQGGADKGMFLLADSSSLQIRWKLSLQGSEGVTEENFALILSKDGTFDLIYGTFDENNLLPSIYTGMSKGDGMTGEITPYQRLASLQDHGFRFLPPHMPIGTQLTTDGVLTVEEAETDWLHQVEVTVTDGNSLTDTRVFRLSGDLDVSVALHPDAGGFLRVGTVTSLHLTLKNRGTTPINAPQLHLTSSDTSCVVPDALYQAVTIQPGSTLTLPDVFSIELKHPLEDGYPLRFELLVQSESRSWRSQFDAAVAASEITISQPAIADGHNQILDAGEVADLVIQIGNEGSLSEEEIAVRLQSFDTAVTIRSSDIQMIDESEPYSRDLLKFQLQRSRTAQPGVASPMRLTVQGKSSGGEVIEFNLPGEKKAVAIVNPESSNTSMHAMSELLDTLHVPFDTMDHLQFPYSNYHLVFLILGHAQGYHVISDEEGSALAQYLSQGGNLYLEGYFPWHYQSMTPLHDMMHYEHELCTRYYFPEIKGVEGTFTAPMNFPYTNALISAPFAITPVAPAYSIFENADDPTRTLEFAYDGADFKTIGSLLEFGSKADAFPPSTRRELMQRYLDFFDVNLTGLRPLFHVASSEICSGSSAVFHDDSYEGIGTWSWVFPGGDPSTSNLQNPTVRYDMPGFYDVELTVSDGQQSRTLKRDRYISVTNCSSAYPAENLPKLLIYPNPATNTIRISGGAPLEGTAVIRVQDLTGRMVLNLIATLDERGAAQVDISALPRGLYIISMLRDGGILTGKLLVK